MCCWFIFIYCYGYKNIKIVKKINLLVEMLSLMFLGIEFMLCIQKLVFN